MYREPGPPELFPKQRGVLGQPPRPEHLAPGPLPERRPARLLGPWQVFHSGRLRPGLREWPPEQPQVPRLAWPPARPRGRPPRPTGYRRRPYLTWQCPED